MDWIEKLFGVSPDNGDGSFEAVIVALCGFAVLAIILATPKARSYLRHLVSKFTVRS
jgi:hypothetical protein